MMQKFSFYVSKKRCVTQNGNTVGKVKRKPGRFFICFSAIKTAKDVAGLK